MLETTKKNSIQEIIKKRKRQRFYLFGVVLITLVCTVVLISYAIGTMGSLYRLPSEITEADKQSAGSFRLGGFVEKGSVQRDSNDHIIFTVTDFKKTEKVVFNGILPDLFREGQGIVVDGKFNAGGVFIASQVLAKHDEKYIAKDTVDRLKAQGLWEGDDAYAD